jgi:hypothetical protein
MAAEKEINMTATEILRPRSIKPYTRSLLMFILAVRGISMARLSKMPYRSELKRCKPSMAREISGALSFTGTTVVRSCTATRTLLIRRCYISDASCFRRKPGQSILSNPMPACRLVKPGFVRPGPNRVELSRMEPQTRVRSERLCTPRNHIDCA